MKKNFLRLTAALALLSSITAMAYQVTVPLPNRSKPALQHAFQQGAQELILRLTASEKTTQSITQDTQKARNWVDEYTTVPNANDSDFPWLLQATYSDHSIQQLLRKNHLTSWKRTPPPVDLLLKTTSDEALPDQDPRWQAMQAAATARGYSFRRLEAVPDKLSGDLLIAVLSNDGVNWSWYHQEQWQQWQQPAGEQWVNQAADTIGGGLMRDQPQQQASNLTPVHLQINGVRDFRDYAQAMQALKKIRGVQSMTDDGIHDDSLSLTLITNGSISDIKQALDGIQQLQAHLGMAATSHADLSYTWGPKPQKTTANDLQYQNAPPTVDEESFAYDNPTTMNNER